VDEAFESALKYGEEGEHHVASWLMRSGAVVAPLYQFVSHDRAPVLLHSVDGRELSRVLPDLTCWDRRHMFFAEVKRKRRWVGPYRSRPRETGFNLSLWRDYLAVAALTGVPIWFFFLHEDAQPTGVFCGELAALAPYVREWDGCVDTTGRATGSPPLALFPESRLLRVADLADVVTG